MTYFLTNDLLFDPVTYFFDPVTYFFDPVTYFLTQ
ncbi:hypothetical protein T06_16182 [Trichinella sp. T6]|nr:hypothetical protein T06_16182 [Trichinella sp. T6]